MLVATAMVAMLAGALYATLHIAFKARSSALAAVENARRYGLAFEWIKADLLSAVVPNGILAGQFVGQAGGGIAGPQADTLTFYAAAMDVEPTPGVGDIKKVEYSCDASSGPNGFVLVRRLTTNLLTTRDIEPNQEIICRGLRAWTIRYFDGTAWQDHWDSASQDNALPKAVEVTLEPAQADEGESPRVSCVIALPCGQGTAAATDTAGGGGS
jgi:type II secretion system protein J